jgi:hypothetical protein
MANQTLSDLVKSLVLGSLNGAIYSAIQFILISGYYDYLIRLDSEKMERGGLSPVQMTNMINKRLVSVWFLLAFTIASYFWHRYSSKIRKSSILFWEAIGLSAIVGWNVVVLILLSIESRLTGQTLGYERAISLSNPLFGPFSLGLVIITNFVYGSSIGVLDKLSHGSRVTDGTP